MSNAGNRLENDRGNPLTGSRRGRGTRTDREVIQRPRGGSCWVCLLLVLALQPPASSLAAKVWTGMGGDRRWETPENWDPEGKPKATDDVQIPYGSGPIYTDGTRQGMRSLRLFGGVSSTPTTLTHRKGSRLDIAAEDFIIIGQNSSLNGAPGSRLMPQQSEGGDVRLEVQNGTIANSGWIGGGSGTSVGDAKKTKNGSKGGRVEIFVENFINRPGGSVTGGEGGEGTSKRKSGDTVGGSGGNVELNVDHFENHGTIVGGLGAGADAWGEAGDGGHVYFGGLGGNGGEVQNDGEIQGGGGGCCAGIPPFGPGPGGSVMLNVDRFVNSGEGRVFGGPGGCGDIDVPGTMGARGGNIEQTKRTKIEDCSENKIGGGIGGSGRSRGANGSWETWEKIVKPSAILLESITPYRACRGGGPVSGMGPDHPSSYAFVRFNSYADTALVLSGVNETVLRADSSVQLDLCPTCLVDLRGNSPGTKVIVAGERICIFGRVLTDPGVSVADLTDPPAMVFTDSLEFQECVGTAMGERRLEQSLPGALAPESDTPSVRLLGANPVRAGEPLGFEIRGTGASNSGAVMVLDVSGRRVAEIWRGQLDAGGRRIDWWPASAHLAPGIYFLSMQAGARTRTIPFVFLP